MGFGITKITNKNLPISPVDGSIFNTGELVKVPFREGYYAVETGSMSFKESGYHTNEDGSDSAIFVTVPSGTPNGARMRFPFYGRKFGVRWQRDNNQANFTVMIDGVAYPVTTNHSIYANESVSLTDGESLVVIEDSLSDGVHYADIQVSAPTTGTSYLVLFGIIVERRAGYEPRPRLNGYNGPFATPTTATGIAKGNPPAKLKSLRKIFYTNTTATSVSVTITVNSVVLWSKQIQANDTVEFDLGEKTMFSSTLNHYASASGVNYTVIGGY